MCLCFRKTTIGIQWRPGLRRSRKRKQFYCQLHVWMSDLNEIFHDRIYRFHKAGQKAYDPTSFGFRSYIAFNNLKRKKITLLSLRGAILWKREKNSSIVNPLAVFRWSRWVWGGGGNGKLSGIVPCVSMSCMPACVLPDRKTILRKWIAMGSSHSFHLFFEERCAHILSDVKRNIQ